MNILEKDLEEIIEKTDVIELQKKGLYLKGKPYRQFRLGNYGIADLIYVSKDYEFVKKSNGDIFLKPFITIQVCELKKNKAGISAFLQALRYSKAISSYLDFREFKNYKIEIFLLAPEIDSNSDYIFLTDLISSDEYGVINNINNYSVKYGFNGIEFNKEHCFSLSKEGFKTKLK